MFTLYILLPRCRYFCGDKHKSEKSAEKHARLFYRGRPYEIGRTA